MNTDGRFAEEIRTDTDMLLGFAESLPDGWDWSMHSTGPYTWELEISQREPKEEPTVVSRRVADDLREAEGAIDELVAEIIRLEGES